MLYICLFFPAVISLAIHKKFYKNEEFDDLLIIYIIYNFLINLSINLLSYFISDIKENIYDINLFTVDFSTKYMILALIISSIFPLLFKFFQSNFKISFKLKEKRK